MPRLAPALLALLILTACGAEGPPTPPTGVTVTGEARLGVVSN